MSMIATAVSCLQDGILQPYSLSSGSYILSALSHAVFVSLKWVVYVLTRAEPSSTLFCSAIVQHGSLRSPLFTVNRDFSQFNSSFSL